MSLAIRLFAIILLTFIGLAAATVATSSLPTASNGPGGCCPSVA